MRLYVEVARRTYARISTYRSATVAGVFTNTVFGFLLAYVLLAVYEQRDTVGGFDALDALTFTFVAQGLLMPLGLFGGTEIADRITTRRRHRRPAAPVRPPGLVGGGRLRQGRLLPALPRHPSVRRRARSCSTCRCPRSGARLAFLRERRPRRSAVAFGWRYLLQLSGFWLLDVRGPNQLGWLAAQFLSGAFIPIVLLPRTGSRPVPPAPVRVDAPGAGRDLARPPRRARTCVVVCALQLAWAVALVAGRACGDGPCRATGGGAGWLSFDRRLGVWRRLVGARIRADWQYRTSFLLFLLSQTLVAGLDLLVIAAIFAQVDTLAGWSGVEVALLYGLAGSAFGLADLLISQVELASWHIKAGTFDLFLLRPVPTLLHLSASEFALRRIGRIVQPLVVLVVALRARADRLEPRGRACSSRSPS